jgi:hypothetical protein
MARETLSRDQIVTAALGLLDAEGLEGMNMRALGQRLDSAATAVYWHVGSRQSLIALPQTAHGPKSCCPIRPGSAGGRPPTR